MILVSTHLHLPRLGTRGTKAPILIVTACQFRFRWLWAMGVTSDEGCTSMAQCMCITDALVSDELFLRAGNSFYE